ncbi:MAG: CBS domain-containing protein [Methanomassiliicoccales archaeon]|nr:CBS domain-containing protein [Methanomassiliicoccales archaeon]
MMGESVETMKRREVLRSQIDAFKVDDLVEEKFESVDPEMGLSDVVAKMRAKGLHEMPVTEGKKLVGVISFSSIIRRKNLVLGMKVGSAMDMPPPVTLTAPITLVAEQFISTGYRQMPVMKNKNIAGVVTRAGMIALIPKIKDIRNMKVLDVMSTNVQTVREDDPVKRAVEIMRKLDIQTLPVVDMDDRLSGIIGIKDIVNYSWNGGPRRQTKGEIVGENDPVEVKVGSVAVDAVVSIAPGKSLGDAVNVMLERNVSTLPVLEKDTLVGIITMYDLIELFASFGKRDYVYTQITGLEAEDRFSLEVMEREIQNGLAKTAKVTKPMLFTMHVTKYHVTGNAAKYSLNARLITEHGTFIGSAVDWNLAKATVDLMDRLGARVMDKKEERISKRKRNRRET